MRAFKIVVFIVVLYAAAWGGEIEVYMLDLGDSDPMYQIPPGAPTVIPDDITALLRECLEFIEDGSIDQGRNLSLSMGVYHPITRDGVAQDEADRAAYEAERYRRETELHKKIKAMIKKLEGENK